MSSRKAFVYLVRADRPRPRLLVFDSLDEAGLEVPKGSVETGETLEEAALREVHEESGIERIRVVRTLGTTLYDREQQHFLLAEVEGKLPERFEHTVTGSGVDRDLRYCFRWIPVDRSLAERLVQGCGAFVDALIEAVEGRSSGPLHSS